MREKVPTDALLVVKGFRPLVHPVQVWREYFLEMNEFFQRSDTSEIDYNTKCHTVPQWKLIYSESFICK